eukprot:1158444-Pelagomonas_calceolata.AAC.7
MEQEGPVVGQTHNFSHFPWRKISTRAVAGQFWPMLRTEKTILLKGMCILGWIPLTHHTPPHPLPGAPSQTDKWSPVGVTRKNSGGEGQGVTPPQTPDPPPPIGLICMPTVFKKKKGKEHARQGRPVAPPNVSPILEEHCMKGCKLCTP